MLENSRVTAYPFSELLKENQEGGGVGAGLKLWKKCRKYYLYELHSISYLRQRCLSKLLALS